EPQGVDRLSEIEARHRATSVKLVRQGHRGRVTRAAIVRNAIELARTNTRELGSLPELAIGVKSKGERMPCQWDFAYASDTGMVSTETARDSQGHIVYRLQYRSGTTKQKAEFLDAEDYNTATRHGDAELVEFVRSTEGRDIEKHYKLRNGEPARNQDGFS